MMSFHIGKLPETLNRPITKDNRQTSPTLGANPLANVEAERGSPKLQAG